jgi:hypothetical protein
MIHSNVSKYSFSVKTWLHLLITVSIAYLIISVGVSLFPNVNINILSIIAAIVVLYITHYQSFILLF